MLFKMDVFKKIPKPYFWIDGIVGTDVHVCCQLGDAGVKIWADTSIELGHIGEPQVITARTVPKYSRVLGEINQELWEDLKGYFHKTDDELEHELILASAGDIRAREWNKEPRNTWEGVKRYYQNTGDQGTLNLSLWNLKYNHARDWAISDSGRILKPGSKVLDYGCGIGYVSLPLAQRCEYQVYAMDIAGLPTMDFLKWRKAKHNLDGNLILHTFEDPVPTQMFDEPLDAIFMISVLEHLWDPYGAIEWMTKIVKPGGFLLCDGWNQITNKDEPQHLCKYDYHKIVKDFMKMGWKSTPENPYLYFRK